MKEHIIVADSSFFICFLDDIKQPQHLLNFTKNFTFRISPTVKREIEQSKNFKLIEKEKSFNFFTSELNLGEALRPLFSNSQLKKGESEVIAIAFLLYNLELKFTIILDDWQARSFIGTFLKYLEKDMTGTIGFIASCCRPHRILKKKVVLELLNQIGHSKFKVKKNILSVVIERVQGYPDD